MSKIRGGKFEKYFVKAIEELKKESK